MRRSLPQDGCISRRAVAGGGVPSPARSARAQRRWAKLSKDCSPGRPVRFAHFKPLLKTPTGGAGDGFPTSATSGRGRLQGDPADLQQGGEGEGR